MPGRELTEDDLKWLEEYRTQVIKAFTPIFSEVADRFSDGERLLKRFNEHLIWCATDHRFAQWTKCIKNSVSQKLYWRTRSHDFTR
jgi:hypothetical protein